MTDWSLQGVSRVRLGQNMQYNAMLLREAADKLDRLSRGLLSDSPGSSTNTRPYVYLVNEAQHAVVTAVMNFHSYNTDLVNAELGLSSGE